MARARAAGANNPKLQGQRGPFGSMGDATLHEEILALQLSAASELGEIGAFYWQQGTQALTLDATAVRLLGCLQPGTQEFRVPALRRLPISGLAGILSSMRASALAQGLASASFMINHRERGPRELRASLKSGLRDGARWIAGALTDISDHRRSEAELRATLSTVPSAMIVMDGRGIIRAFSAAAERMFGRVERETLGLPIETLMPEPYRSEHAGYLRRYLETNDPRIIGKSRIMNAVRADGTEFPIELWVGDASTSSERMFTGFIRDHTARFETEAKLQNLQNDLMHVARLSAVGELSMALAHELNQPLGAIVNHLSTAEYLAGQQGAASQEHLLRAIGEASEQAMRAGAIIKRLRSFIEKGEADMRIEPAATIVAEATALLSSAMRKSGIELNVVNHAGDASVFADRVQIQQVLFNLLRNAMEALEAPDLLQRHLLVSIQATEPGEVEIIVSDTGPGVSTDMADRLFRPFSTEKSDGMGVGLAISKRIVEAHGGQLLYHPAEGGGAAFRVTLPAATPEERIDG